MRIEQVVRDKIDSDTEFAERIAERTLGGSDTVSLGRIADFFPEFEERGIANWANWTREIDLPQQLLLGRPTIFDVEPMSGDKFAKKYRISIETAVELAELGAILPNLYNRDPKEWIGNDDMLPLVERSFVNGVRVNSFFKSLFANFDTEHDRHRKELDEAFTHVAKSDSRAAERLLIRARVSHRPYFGRIVGNRWAYLDAVEPDASRFAALLLQDGELEQVVDFTRVAKHLFASQVSASAGGEFFWGAEDLVKYHTVASNVSDIAPRMEAIFKHPERLEFLLGELIGTVPYAELHRPSEKSLLAILKDPEIRDYQAKLKETIDSMDELSRKGDVSAETVRDWAELQEEINRSIGSYKSGVRVVNPIVLGFMLSEFLGLGPNVIAESELGQLTDPLAQKLYSRFNPARHRFVVSVDKLKRHHA